MYKTVVVLPDGTRLSSGQGEKCPVMRYSLTRSVNDGTQLCPGAVCADVLELTLLMGEQAPEITPGMPLTVLRQDGQGNGYTLGVFLAEKPVRTGAATLRITAYSKVILLDRDLSGWLESLDGWPYTLQDFCRLVCRACALELVEGQLPNGSFSVEKFSLPGVTGRQLMHWIAQAAGCFCRATAQGALELGWYTPSGLTVTPNAGQDGLYYYQKGFAFEDYQVLPVEKVQLKNSDEDVGAVYPQDAGAVNTYVITGNPLLATGSGSGVGSVAQTLYERLSAVTYTPCQLRLPQDHRICPGQVLTVTDGQGNAHQVYVMRQVQTGQKQTVYCTGTLRRDSVAAVNELSLAGLSGKVLQLQTRVDGLRVKNADTQGKCAQLELNVAGIATEVSRQQTQTQGLTRQLTALKQDSEQLSLSVEQLRQTGASSVITKTGFVFDSDGLQIRKDGSEMENLLDETGMYVKHLDQVILQANSDGVEAADITVRNYLVVGGHARFEDYNNGQDGERTACFWI